MTQAGKSQGGPEPTTASRPAELPLWAAQLPAPLPAKQIEAELAALMSCPAVERRSRLHAHGPEARLQLVATWVEAGYALRHTSPQRYLVRAQAARQACRYLNAPVRLKLEARQVRAAALAFLGNAYRVLGKFPAAYRCFRLVAAGAPWQEENPVLAGLASTFHAGTHRACRHFGLVEPLLQAALRFFLKADAAEHHAQTLLLLAKSQEDSGEPEKAVEVLTDLIATLDASRFPQLALTAFHNLIHLCTALGHLSWAAFLLERMEWRYTELAAHFQRSRAVGLKGRLLREAGNPAPAIPLLAETRRQLAAEGAHYDSALIGLEQALAHAHLGQNRQVRELAQEMYPTFQAHGVPREATMALLQFHEAALDWQVEEELIRDVIERLEEIRRRPLGPPPDPAEA